MAVGTTLPKRANRAPFSPSFKREELYYCTEELGSESISCRSGTTEGTRATTQNHGYHGSLRAACGYRERDVLGEASVGTLQKVCLSGMNDQMLPHSAATIKSSSLQRIRAYPPPLSSLLSGRPIMRSFKSNGRFVLQRVDATSSSPFRAVRENGRLRLILASSASGLDCNGERQVHALLTQKKNKTYGACKDDADNEQFSVKMMMHRPAPRVLWLPRSIKFFSEGWGSGGASYVCLPSTLKLILERAERLSLHKRQAASHDERRNARGNVHSGIKGNAQLQYEGVKTNAAGPPAAVNTSSLPLLGNQLGFSAPQTDQLQKLKDANPLCCAYDNSVSSSDDDVEKRGQRYAIFSFSFNGVLVLLVVERTATSILAIKGVSIYHNHNHVPAALQQNAASHHTWHTSKPIDFRIAA